MSSLDELRLDDVEQSQDVAIETDIYLFGACVADGIPNRVNKQVETDPELSMWTHRRNPHRKSSSVEGQDQGARQLSPLRSHPAVSIQRGHILPTPSPIQTQGGGGGGILTTGRKIVPARDNGRKIRFTNFACFLDAAWRGDMEEVVKMVEEEGVHPDTCNADGVTALHCAATCSNQALVEYLISKGANVNVADDHGWTPLHGAAYNNHAEVIGLLLSHGADVEALDSQEQTPISLPTDIDVIRCFGEVVAHKSTSEWLVALYDFHSDFVENAGGDELNFERGDKLRIINRNDQTWWLAELQGRKGYIPRQFVQ